MTDWELKVMLKAMNGNAERPTRTVLAVAVALAGLSACGCSSGNVSVGSNLAADSGAGGGNPGDPTPAQLLALAAPCTEISMGELAPEAGRTADVPVCALSNALFWRSELAVDCDGIHTNTCNKQQDPQYQATTVGKDSSGNSLDASVVPYIEVPAQSAVFDYKAAGLSMGSVAVVIYKDRLAYGVVGHEQDADVIGSASYALASALGIDPDPVNGGLQSEDVTYFAFTGPSNVVPALEDTTAVATLGKTAASALVTAGR